MSMSKINELEKSIRYLESEESYCTSMIANLMAEANLIDQQIETFSKSGLAIRLRIADLRAELADTV